MDGRKEVVVVWGPLAELGGDSLWQAEEFLKAIASMAQQIPGVQVPPLENLYDESRGVKLGSPFNNQMEEASLMVVAPSYVSVETGVVVGAAEQRGKKVLMIFLREEDVSLLMLKNPAVDGRHIVLREDGEDLFRVFSAIQNALNEK